VSTAPLSLFERRSDVLGRLNKGVNHRDDLFLRAIAAHGNTSLLDPWVPFFFCCSSWTWFLKISAAHSCLAMVEKEI